MNLRPTCFLFFMPSIPCVICAVTKNSGEQQNHRNHFRCKKYSPAYPKYHRGWDRLNRHPGRFCTLSPQSGVSFRNLKNGRGFFAPHFPIIHGYVLLRLRLRHLRHVGRKLPAGYCLRLTRRPVQEKQVPGKQPVSFLL